MMFCLIKTRKGETLFIINTLGGYHNDLERETAKFKR
jgi:hypothetical protein